MSFCLKNISYFSKENFDLPQNKAFKTILLASDIALNIQNYSLSNTLKFVQLSDIHYSVDREDTSYKLLSHTRELLDDAVKQINEQKNLKFVVVTGDGIVNHKQHAVDRSADIIAVDASRETAFDGVCAALGITLYGNVSVSIAAAHSKHCQKHQGQSFHGFHWHDFGASACKFTINTYICVL